MKRIIYTGCIALLGGLVLSAGACTSKVDECNQVIDVVNETVTRMSAIENALASDDPAVVGPAVDQGVKTIDETVSKLTSLKLKIAEVQKFSADYQGMVKELGVVYKEIKTQATAAAEVVQTVETAGKKIEEAVGKFSAVCTSAEDAAKDCAAAGEIIDAMPDDPTDDVEKVTASVAKLRGMTIGNANLKAAVDEIAGAFESVAGAVPQLKTVEQQVEASQKKAEGLSERESKLVDDFNAFCQAP